MKKKMSAKKKRTIVILSVLGVLIIGAILFMQFKPDKKLAVDTVKVRKETINETLDTTGTVAAGSQEEFMLPSGVKVLSVNVKEGDTVKAGQVLATFDTASLNEALTAKKAAYEKAQAAYDSAVANAGDKGRIAQLKKQIADLEKQIAELEAKSETTVTAAKPSAKTEKKESVKVSDSLVKRFMRIAKLFGVEYSQDTARAILTNMLSSGSSSGDISSMLDNLSSISAMSGSFDMSAFSGMTDSSTLMSAKINLVQLKAQLTAAELQSDETYISTFKTIANKTKESYEKTLQQVNSMKSGWVAAKDGVVSEVNFSADGANESTSAPDFDISSVLSAVTSGGDATSMLSSFLNAGSKAAIKVLYYPLVADISLSKYDVLEVELNQDVIIKTASDTLLDGKVSYVSPVASNSGGLNIGSIMGGSSGSSTTIPAQITIKGADRSVIVGVDVNVSIITDTKENATVVPVEAICIENEDIFVYALEDGRAVKKPVELGISNDTYYEVVSGVSVGDVLIKNTTGLEDGIKVETK